MDNTPPAEEDLQKRRKLVDTLLQDMRDALQTTPLRLERMEGAIAILQRRLHEGEPKLINRKEPTMPERWETLKAEREAALKAIEKDLSRTPYAKLVLDWYTPDEPTAQSTEEDLNTIKDTLDYALKLKDVCRGWAKEYGQLCRERDEAQAEAADAKNELRGLRGQILPRLEELLPLKAEMVAIKDAVGKLNPDAVKQLVADGLAASLRELESLKQENARLKTDLGEARQQLKDAQDKMDELESACEDYEAALEAAGIQLETTS